MDADGGSQAAESEELSELKAAQAGNVRVDLQKVAISEGSTLHPRNESYFNQELQMFISTRIPINRQAPLHYCTKSTNCFISIYSISENVVIFI